jgi:hypothetical protein
MGKNSEGSDRGLILKYCPGIRLEGLRKTMRNRRIAVIWAEISTRDLPNIKQE